MLLAYMCLSMHSYFCEPFKFHYCLPFQYNPLLQQFHSCLKYKLSTHVMLLVLLNGEFRWISF